MLVKTSKLSKYKLLSILRSLGLLQPVDFCRYCLKRVLMWPRNRRFIKMHPDFPTPPHDLAFDALNHADWFVYRESGLKHAKVFARIIQQYLSRPSLSIFEWGCGPGRLIRHMSKLLECAVMRLTASDYNPKSIDWCRHNLSNIHFFENGLRPPLPFTDDQFDVVYNFSVFTHLSEDVQILWAKELYRVLKPGGLFICTTHGDHYRYLLASEWERTRYHEGHVVVQGNYTEGRKWFFAIHPPRFVREVLLKEFYDVQRVPTGEEEGLLQEVWIGWKK